jgi:pyruvate dehydrogenase E1 component alpha subunit
VIKKTSTPKKTEVVDPGYDARQAPINAKLGPDEKIAFFRDMMRIRRFEERCLRSYTQGKIGGFLHLYIGQESIAVG